MRFGSFIFLGVVSGLLELNGRFDDNLRYELNKYLAKYSVPDAPNVPVNSRFLSANTERLQRFLAKYGRLPITGDLDNLAIATVQGTLREFGFYHDKPCGTFGPGTVRGIQSFLQYKGFYKKRPSGR